MLRGLMMRRNVPESFHSSPRGLIPAYNPVLPLGAPYRSYSRYEMPTFNVVRRLKFSYASGNRRMTVPYALNAPARKVVAPYIEIHGFHSASRPSVQCVLTRRRRPSCTARAALSTEPERPRQPPQAPSDGSCGPGCATGTVTGAGGSC